MVYDLHRFTLCYLHELIVHHLSAKCIALLQKQWVSLNSWKMRRKRRNKKIGEDLRPAFKIYHLSKLWNMKKWSTDCKDEMIRERELGWCLGWCLLWKNKSLSNMNMPTANADWDLLIFLQNAWNVNVMSTSTNSSHTKLISAFDKLSHLWMLMMYSYVMHLLHVNQCLSTGIFGWLIYIVLKPIFS